MKSEVSVRTYVSGLLWCIRFKTRTRLALDAGYTAYEPNKTKNLDIRGENSRGRNEEERETFT